MAVSAAPDTANRSAAPRSLARVDEPTFVLIVDSETADALTLASHLRAAGFRVEIAADGARALTILSRETPEVIITAIDLPDMTGLDLARQVQPTAQRPFLVATEVRPPRADDLFAAGFHRCLQKPIHAAEVETAIRLHQFQQSLHSR
jgi:CheY-like chemotaxis protein